MFLCVHFLLCFESIKTLQHTYSGVYTLSRSCSVEFKALHLIISVPNNICVVVMLRKVIAMVVVVDT